MFGIGSVENQSVTLTDTLLQTAETAADKKLPPQNIADLAAKLADKLKPVQKDIKGLYTGGTLCTEAHLVLQSHGVAVGSNAVNPNPATPHQLIDLGADEYTLGKPHPMLEPAVRTSFLIDELNNPATAVIMIDLVLGYGAHHDPATEVCDALKSVDHNAIILASVCGTADDPQNYDQQCQSLQSAGAVLCQCNSEMATLAAAVIEKL